MTTSLALCAFALGGCDRSDAAPPAPKPSPAIVGGPIEPVAIGALAQAPDYQMSVESVTDCDLPPPFAAAAGSRKVAVEVTLEGTTEREVPANVFYAILKSDRGLTYEATLAGCKPVLRAERITAGKKARGVITFEVPTSVRELTLSYAPTVIGGGREELRFRLQ